MTIRTRRIEGSRGLILAIALIVPAFLAGCATSHTHLDWGVRVTPRNSAAVARRTNSYSDRTVARNVPTPRPQPGWYKDTRPAPRDTVVDNSPLPVGNGQFAWPMNGRVISEFGSTASGERNDGINIAAVTGNPIRAAADGNVSYTGNDLKNYGNLVLIRHGDNYVTAYAHAERILVGRGDHVVKGQIIAYAGDTGDVSSPQLHFEIRRGVTPVNPRPLLGRLIVASR